VNGPAHREIPVDLAPGVELDGGESLPLEVIDKVDVGPRIG
jgi:hypothetical protein